MRDMGIGCCRETRRRDRRNWHSPSCVFLAEPQREKQNMPLLLYFPLIIWLGMLEAMKDDLREPATIKARRQM